jgi:hypothetical protein
MATPYGGGRPGTTGIPTQIGLRISTASGVANRFALRGDRVAAITGFPGTSVFLHFGLPRTLRAG